MGGGILHGVCSVCYVSGLVGVHEIYALCDRYDLYVVNSVYGVYGVYGVPYACNIWRGSGVCRVCIYMLLSCCGVYVVYLVYLGRVR